jgi:hypothetical protein
MNHSQIAVAVHRCMWLWWLIAWCISTIQGEETDTTTITTPSWTMPVPLPVRTKAGERFLQLHSDDDDDDDPISKVNNEEQDHHNPDEKSPGQQQNTKQQQEQQFLRHPVNISTESLETRILQSTIITVAQEHSNDETVDLEHWKPPVPLPVRTKAGERTVRRAHK